MTEQTTTVPTGGDDLGTAAASIEGILFGAEAAEKPQDERKAREASDDTPASQDAPDEAAAPGEGDEAPEDTPASEEGKGEEEPETAIDPPASWSAEARERFKQLPPELQQYLHERESERDRGVNQRMNEIAEQRKALEAEHAAIQQERQHYASQLQAFTSALQQQLAGEFADIKTVADLEKLATEDPDRFARWQAKQHALQAAQAQQLHLAQQQTKEHEEKLKAWTAEQEKILFDRFPAWKKDLAAGQREIAEIKRYLVAEGIDRQQAEDLRDANLITLARKAMLYDRAQAARAKAEKAPAPAPKVQKPGTARPNTDAEERKAAKFNRLRQSGRVEDAAALIADLI